MLRIGLGAVLVYAAWLKLRDPWMLFAMAIDGYQLLPQWAVVAVARTLPWFELALGLVLIAGVWLRTAAGITVALQAAFIAAMAHSYAKGMKIDCGCFGSGDPISPWTLSRDGALLLAALAVGLGAWARARLQTR